ncbi:DUF1810 domain-containing protein [Skermanella mucosa]|uniref:DUF1810 domain-containing protein n=1 Tax=Skermanella mucosa TaxID=1789672 RepID=UPI00192B25C2|nr:DUF1810 domain-containing protein [Skermanella mucosa]UEM18493.1 DUF1810 domain-containing protein [Skermanella mucosa]
MADEFHLDRFVRAQEPVIARVRRELAAGRKDSHWMWFVFPQIAGLGYSAMARRYAIQSLAEARAYLEHPVLGSRLVELTRVVNQVKGRSVHEIFGRPDDLKFHSSMTLFALAKPDGSAFHDALQRHFGGALDRGTVERLEHS